jgi:hypothetical protein
MKCRDGEWNENECRRSRKSHEAGVHEKSEMNLIADQLNDTVYGGMLNSGGDFHYTNESKQVREATRVPCEKIADQEQI